MHKKTKISLAIIGLCSIGVLYKNPLCARKQAVEEEYYDDYDNGYYEEADADYEERDKGVVEGTATGVGNILTFGAISRHEKDKHNKKHARKNEKNLHKK